MSIGDPLVNVENEPAKVNLEVIVENIDEAPEFSKKNNRFFIAENLPPGQIIPNSQNLASDPENDTFRFILKSDFHIDRSQLNGEISSKPKRG